MISKLFSKAFVRRHGESLVQASLLVPMFIGFIALPVYIEYLSAYQEKKIAIRRQECTHKQLYNDAWAFKKLAASDD